MGPENRQCHRPRAHRDLMAGGAPPDGTGEPAMPVHRAHRDLMAGGAPPDGTGEPAVGRGPLQPPASWCDPYYWLSLILVHSLYAHRLAAGQVAAHTVVPVGRGTRLILFPINF